VKQLAKPNLDDYNTVPERMTEFFEKYPTGGFQSECQFTEIDGRWAAIVKASAYRTPDDPLPGNGLAFEFIPGTTTFTKDSELQNAETAAWGRAVVAVGAADTKKGIASREEVRNRSFEQHPAQQSTNLEGRDQLRELCEERAWPMQAIADIFQGRYGTSPKAASNDDLVSFVALLDQGAITIDVDAA
jgi:hypothetical protein